MGPPEFLQVDELMLLSLEDSFEQHKMDPSIQVTDLSRPSPSTSFPSELLVQIFILAIEELEPLDQWKRLARFSSVCRSWKKFVIETALLWRNISLNSDTPRSKTILAIRRSGETALRLIASCDGYTDAAIAEAQLHRVETLDYTAARGMLNPGTLDAPILRRLTVTGGFQTYLGDVPLVSPRFPLKRLEALIPRRITYPSCSPFFRPTLKILRLEVCPDRGSGSSLDAFLRALEDMPVLEELKIESTFTSPLPLHTILPVVNLPSLRELSIQEDALQAAVMLNHLEFPGSMVYNKAGHGTPFEAAPVGITELGGAQIVKDPFELLAAVFRKLSGHGLIGPASVLRELFVETNGGSIGKIIAANKARGTFSHVVVDTSKVLAGSLSERIFALASEDCLAEIRVVSLKSKWGFHDVSACPSLVTSKFQNLEVLILDRLPTILDSIFEAHALSQVVTDPQTPATQAKSRAAPFPFPKLHTFSLWFAYFRPHAPSSNTRTKLPDPSILTESLVRMLQAHVNEGKKLTTLELPHATGVLPMDLDSLRPYVDNIKWAGEVSR